MRNLLYTYSIPTAVLSPIFHSLYKQMNCSILTQETNITGYESQYDRIRNMTEIN